MKNNSLSLPVLALIGSVAALKSRINETQMTPAVTLAEEGAEYCSETRNPDPGFVKKRYNHGCWVN
jgi:hypothetical protein